MSRSLHDTNYIFRDLYGLVLVLFIGLVVILATMAQNDTAQAEVDVPGDILATIYWDEGDFDVDMWVDGPGEALPVGYSNSHGLLWDLLRDDLGRYPDLTKVNFETAATRGQPAGEYRVNVHCFRCPQLPIHVSLEVVRRGDGQARAREVIGLVDVTLNKDREEKTALAFTLDAAGKVVPDSMTTIFAPLREMGKGNK